MAIYSLLGFFHAGRLNVIDHNPDVHSLWIRWTAMDVWCFSSGNSDVVILSVPSLGVTVCVLSVLGVHPGEMGDTVLLSRLERDSYPVTVRIPTAQRKVGYPPTPQAHTFLLSLYSLTLFLSLSSRSLNIFKFSQPTLYV